mmetsp:Transcript_31201/g.46137  ORF Transcript_31201/g.46137 Transcript_31201/m.46137 type:complete len:760 (-) Transcript_31201:643-2922(-)|eukprot:CAMPEP_0195529176 /NCGR_PEP_ID=MMETSP0794_2-20130614/31622_1 /TAXON_ID=515487 /ORGANISM="Stephanopyxis turris, Strain CCMP 815" /LENGTH=759 /DNA_ID=CAMNT_0040660441 /DNA_START=71 /DNA_END=2350 /DNA_ORIENTATION=+
MNGFGGHPSNQQYQYQSQQSQQYGFYDQNGSLHDALHHFNPYAMGIMNQHSTLDTAGPIGPDPGSSELPTNFPVNCFGYEPEIPYSNAVAAHLQSRLNGLPTNNDRNPLDVVSSPDVVKPRKEPEPTMMVSGLSLKPMTAEAVLETVELRCNDVLNHYLPCVEFLVSCQQDLRAGLAMQRRQYKNRQAARQFYNVYIDPLPARFNKKNRYIIPLQKLNEATQQLNALCRESKLVEHMGCETMKNTFLGGMRDGESWGLRKWLSKNGAALNVCNELELILTALQKLDTESDFTISLGAKVRRFASSTLTRLVKDIPKAYQEFSSAHPYLPFFHRLESALKGLADFDPEDDDVLIIDDSEVEKMKQAQKKKEEEKQRQNAPQAQMFDGPSFSPNLKRERTKDENDAGFKRGKKRGRFDHNPSNEDSASEEQTLERHGDQGSSEEKLCFAQGAPNSILGRAMAARENDDGDDDSDCEVVCVMVKKPGIESKATKSDSQEPSETQTAVGRSSPKDAADELLHEQLRQIVDKHQNDWQCSHCTFMNMAYSESCIMCESERVNDNNSSVTLTTTKITTPTTAAAWDPNTPSLEEVAENMASLVEKLKFNSTKPATDFWDYHWGFVVKLFASYIRKREAVWFLEPVEEEELNALGRPPYRSIVKNPLSFRCIFNALTDRNSGGILKSTNLGFNVSHGRDLIQAIDLVFLNALAYNGKEKTELRTDTTFLRKTFWDSVRKKSLGDRSVVPTKRGETSGFVVVKNVLG